MIKEEELYKNNPKVIEPNPKPIRLFFFWTGIIATISYRIIIILNFYSPLWVKIAWYIGTIGFVIYFLHRYNVAKKRSNLIKKYDLVEVVKKAEIEPLKKEALYYLLKTNLTSKSKWNSALIFLLSLIALIIAIILDIFSFIN